MVEYAQKVTELTESMTDLRTEESSNAERSMTEVENQHEEINGEEY